jgi:hypothetical protein
MWQDCLDDCIAPTYHSSKPGVVCNDPLKSTQEYRYIRSTVPKDLL